MRVLVVEDELRMAALLKRGLEEDTYAVDVASIGPDAVWHSSEFDYDAVLLDLMLPGMDGVAVCRELRGAGRWMPVLMLTARDAVEDRVRGLGAGADEHLAKPSASQSCGRTTVGAPGGRPAIGSGAAPCLAR